jgi:HTH-type transcriptional regulator/antitoxin HigA
MIMEKRLVEAFPAGEYLSSELEARDWSQADFAEILGRPTQFVSEIISGKKEITRESASQIGAALGTSAALWLNLQNSYLLSQQVKDKTTLVQLDHVRRRARLNELAPLTVMRKRGFLKGDTLEELESEVMHLFRMDSLEGQSRVLAAARRTNVDEPMTPTQNAWLACAHAVAEDIETGPFDKKKLRKLAASLSPSLRDNAVFGTLPTRFAEVGVRLVYVEAFPASKLDGASFALNGDHQRPVIAISGRGKRLDKVLFTLLHEVAHVVNGDIDKGLVLHDEQSHTLGNEEAANALAGEWAVPGGLPAHPSPIRAAWIEKVASKAGIPPIVVIGKLQKEGALDWRTQLVKGAPSVYNTLEEWNRRGV